MRARAFAPGAAAAAALVLASWFAAADDAGAPATPAPSSAPAGSAAPASSTRGFAPDPMPSVQREQWLVELRWEAGTARLVGARRVELPRPAATARNMGRFALELYVGGTLLDRVRFDFPLLGTDPEPPAGKRKWDDAISFERGLSTRTRLWVPDLARATRAVLVDRATGVTTALAWPFAPAPADAGADVVGDAASTVDAGAD